MKMAHEYFISYRRKAGGEVQAREVANILSKYVGKDGVFYDRKHIGEGSWRKRLEDALAEAEHFVLLVNEASANADDSVYYQEIDSALKSDKLKTGYGRITVIVYDSDSYDKLLNLERFAELKRRDIQKVSYVGEYGDSFEERLVEHFQLKKKVNLKPLFVAMVIALVIGSIYYFAPKIWNTVTSGDTESSPKLTYDSSVETVSNPYPKRGDTVTIIFKEKPGFALPSITVNGKTVGLTDYTHTFIIQNDVNISAESCYEEDISTWISSNMWPCGRWKGGNSDEVPDGVGISVVFTQRVRLNSESAIDNPVGDKMADKGDRINDGCFHQGNFRYGTIIHSDGTTEIIRP